jgi:hypothetical protein
MFRRKVIFTLPPSFMTRCMHASTALNLISNAIECSPLRTGESSALTDTNDTLLRIVSFAKIPFEDNIIQNFASADATSNSLVLLHTKVMLGPWILHSSRLGCRDAN